MKPAAIWDKLKQFVRFGLVGLLNTAIFLAVYYAAIYLGLHYIAANALGFAASVLNAFFFNTRYIFKTEERRSKLCSFLKSAAVYGFTFLLGNALLYIWVEVLRISKYIAPLMNAIVTVPTNFVLIKLWAMRTEKNTDEDITNESKP